MREEVGLPIEGVIGEKAFPSIEQMLKVDEETLRDMGMGYRAKFITQTVKQVHSNGGEKWLLSLREKKDQEEVIKELTSLLGVGRKVADCVRLFSLDNSNAIPVDTHVF